MQRKTRLRKSVILFLSAIFFLTACYSKENFVSRKPYSNQKEYARKVSQQDVNKFLNSVRMIDGNVEAKYRMARYFQKKKKHKIALEALKEVIQGDPTHVKAYNAMGVSYDYLGDFKKAVQSYKLALKINPNLDYVHNNLGYAYLLHEKYDDAIYAFQKAIALNDRNKRYRNNLALLYVMKERYDLAIQQLKDIEGGPHAGETVAKLAQKLGKKDFEKQIISVLERMALEKALVRETKTAPGSSTAIKEKIKIQKTESAVRSFGVISDKIEKPETDANNSEPAGNQDSVASEPERTKHYKNEIVVKKNTSDSQSGENVAPMPILKSWEETCAKIAEISEYNPAISVISEADRVSAHTVRERSNAAPKNDKPHVNDDQKIPHQLVFLAATELSSPSAAENPVAIEQKARSNDPAPPSNLNAQEITKNPQNKIKPRVVDVAEVFNFAGKNDENAGLVESAGKVVADGVGQRSSKTRKISPVYPASASSSEETDSKSFSGIEILSLQNDEKTKQADRPDEMRSTKPDKYLVELEIANGCGVKGTAGRIRDLLKENGFKIVKITNANFTDHINTKIFYYNGHRRTVDRIMQKLSCCADERNIIELENLGNRIKIIIGKDLSPPVWKKAERSASGDQS